MPPRPGKRRTFRSLLVRGLVAAGVLVLSSGAWVWVGCGGTTGQPDMPKPMPGASTDATIPETSVSPAGDARGSSPGADADDGTFDVVIPYANRIVPEAHAPTEAAVLDWPACAPDVCGTASDPSQVTADSGWTSDYGNCANFALPAVYDDGGVPVPAPPGSVCATHAWLGHKEWDDCLRGLGGPNVGYAPPANYTLPPCHQLVDAGNAMTGLGAGQSLFALCQQVVTCIEQTGCAETHPTPGTVAPTAADACLCGKGVGVAACELDASGPCKNQVLAAMGLGPNGIVEAIGHSNDVTTPQYVGFGVIYADYKTLNQVCSDVVLEAGAD